MILFNPFSKNISAIMNYGASLGVKRLDRDARREITAFAKDSLGPGGGFVNRNGVEDIYYTVFGLQLLSAFREPIPEITVKYIDAFGNGSSLDFVHKSCLARCRRIINGPGDAPGMEIARGLSLFQAANGLFSLSKEEEKNPVYATFMALLAMDDFKIRLQNGGKLKGALNKYRTADGAYANQADLDSGTATATAAAVIILWKTGVEIPGQPVSWLRERIEETGGYGVKAVKGAPVPDMLSTATTLFALAAARSNVPEAQLDRCAEFTEALWQDSGGFSGTLPDPVADTEYTYYALLSLARR